MTRGRLRVMLGAAPGVGKTYAMLEKGHRLAAAGRDVVIGIVETHGRAATAALVENLEVVPRRSILHRGVPLDELDVEAVIARHPDIALVDELAHTTAPGSANDKRWRDVEAILDAGIDVISTVNIQHIESLSDVVRQITGIDQRERIPDEVLRSADQVELVDLTPQSLRDRLSAGVVYPEARIDAALSNYFRLGNLTALRELALLWLADEVDSSLQRYRAEKGIAGAWNARERVVVALTGGPEGETLLRRGARIASRSSGGLLFAVHVSSPDGLADSKPELLAEQRALTESLGGTYAHVVGEQIPRSLVDYARSVDATQLVIGVSRRGRLRALLTGAGTSATVIREAGDIDVHIVSHAAAGGRRIPTVGGGSLSLRRRLAAFALAALTLPLLTLLLSLTQGEDSITIEVLSFQLLIVVIALIGGIWPAVTAAVISGVLLDYFFVDPVHTITISDPLHLAALLIFVIVAVLVSLVVDASARRSRLARRAAAEAETLASVASAVLTGEDALQALISRLRESFGMTSVILRSRGDVLYVATDGSIADDSDIETTLPIGSHATLYLRGGELDVSDRRILGAFLSQVETALDQRELTAEAERMRPVAEADRLRTALLASLGHDLRRPLASATAAVTSLRSDDIPFSDNDRADLLETAEISLNSLTELIAKLLDASRLQAGVLGVTLDTVEIDDIVTGALEELGWTPANATLELSPADPVTADPALLQRAVVNLLDNAARFSPSGTVPVIATSQHGDRVQVRVIDTGPGIPPEKRDDVFVAFQRLGDTDNSTGIGLGLALSKGFIEAMGGTLEAEDTPGGGLTMVVELPSAREDTA